MVLLHVKRGEESQFLYETSTTVGLDQLAIELVTIYNGRLKVSRVCSEIEELVKYGTMLPPDMLGLTEEQVDELHLVDEWADKCIPSGGWRFNRDPVGRRNGRQPQAKIGEVLKKAIEDAKAMISKKLVNENKLLTQRIVQDALDLLRGAVTIVYPMQLPPHDPIRMEFGNTEDLTGTQASLEVIEPSKVQLWFAGKLMLSDKCLGEIVGPNEKTKVIVKLVKLNEGAPGREPVISEEAKKQMMLHAYRRQEELKKLEQDDDDQYLDSAWSDSRSLKRQVHGLEDVKFKFTKCIFGYPSEYELVEVSDGTVVGLCSICLTGIYNAELYDETTTVRSKE